MAITSFIREGARAALKATFAGATGILALSAATMLPAGAVTTSTTATFTGVTTACPVCVSKDAAGLVVQANGHSLPTGWDVKTGVSGLYLANGSGALFSLPGKTFDLTGLKLQGTSRVSSTTSPITYTLVAFHPGVPLPDVVQKTIKARTVTTMAFTPAELLKLQSAEAVYLRMDATVGQTYVIGLTYTPY